MTVKAVLKGKGKETVNIDPAATLLDAARKLAQHKIGALLVVGSDKRMCGLLSERDIVSAVAARGPEALTERVDGAMTKKVITCGENETMAEIMERMTNGKFRHVPVIDRGELIGIISIGDVVKYRLQEMEQESAQMRDYIQTA